MNTAIKLLGLVSATLLFLNCGNAALIKKADGTSVAGRISAGDGENVYIESMSGDMAIKKSEITDIDHPGNGLAVTGAALTAYGILNIVVGVPQCDEQENPTAFCIGVFTPAAVGAPMFVHGLMIWNKSKKNLNTPKSSALLNTQLLPLYSYQSGEAKYGLVFLKSF